MSERSVSEKQKPLGEQKMKIRKSAVLTIITCATFLAVSVQASPFAQDASSGQTDEVLFHKATVAAQHSRHAEARSLMETLINSHPDSDYVPLAKFGIANAWYAEGSYQQAELEYRDFVTFFPNRPEVTEARTRIAFIDSGKK
jgi:outer membrane protein assembly factor BamD